ncbi:DUF4350 domain-containing protein [Ferruginibacter sp.]
MKNKITHIFLLLMTVAGVLAGCSNNSRIPSLEETFSRTDKKPFGAYIAYKQLENIFSSNSIRDKRQSFDKTWDDISDTASLYVCFASILYTNEEEVKAMLDYVYAGNSLFIAADYFDDNLLKEIGCQENYKGYRQINFFDSLRNTDTKFSSDPYSYYYKPFANSFAKYNEAFTRVLGVNENNDPNYIVYFHGKGKLFLHCDPRAFSNYFLLKNDNYKYLQNVFSYMGNSADHYSSGSPDHVYWDNHYWTLNRRKDPSKKKDDDGNSNSFSSLGEILSHPALAWAFWLLLLLLLLYVLFEGKRRQRIIEKRKPNENTTVTFTETIGRLYLQKKDNKNIAEKMSTYFNEYVRNNYFLNTSMVNDDFITTLSRKSGVEREKVDSLYRAMQHAQNNPEVDDYQLLSLNQQIQQFFKKQ